MSASDGNRARREELSTLRDTLSRPLPERDARYFYDDERQWIEVRLRATRESVASIAEIEWRRRFAVGDEIRTDRLFALAHCRERA